MVINRIISSTLLAFSVSCIAMAQSEDSSAPVANQESKTDTETNGYNVKVFQHLDLSLTLGTTGLGFDLEAPISRIVKVRTGFSFMPRFNYTMHFGIQAYDNDNGILETKFDKLAGMMKDFTGYDVDSQIDMIGQPNYYNFKLLVDVYPFKNKKWHLTGGFYLGNSNIGRAFNTTEDMTSLLAVGMYNNMYDFFTQQVTDEYGFTDYRYMLEPIYGDVYLDPDVGDQMRERFTGYGRMGIHMGDYKDGSPYMMEPGSDGMVKANVKVNRFKPYLGFGYGDDITKDKSLRVSFDCGVMFWGGQPKIITHDGTDLANDVNHVRGKVGDYVDIIKTFKVFPVIDLRITKRLF